MKHQQSGFTLIELIMVIIILGILAATAIPRFHDMSSDAAIAATEGVAGALGAASAINYAKFSLDGGGVTVDSCDDVGLALEGGLPSGYSVGTTAIAAGSTNSCTVTFTDDTAVTAAFTGHGT